MYFQNSILKLGQFRVVSRELELYQKNTYKAIASIMSMFSSKLTVIENLIKVLSSPDEECSTCHDQAGIDHVHFIAKEGIVINPFENVPSLIMFSCSTCSNFAPAICTGCERVFYCSKKCQLQNWKEHSKICFKKFDDTEKNFKNTLKELKQNTSDDKVDGTPHLESSFNSACNMDSSVNEKVNGLNLNKHDRSKEDNSKTGGDMFSQLKSESNVEKLPTPNNTFTLTQSSKSSNSIPRMPQNDKIVERIPKAEYPLLDEFKAVIPYGETPSSFYVSSSSDSKKAESITIRLGEICSNLPTWEGAKYLNSGDYCAALFEQDKLWYRARVRENSNSQVLIQFIDFGNDETVGHKDLRPLTAELAKVPALAIHCCLNNVKPFPHTTWSEDAINLFSNSVFDQGFNKCKIFSIENNLYLVDLLNSDGQSLSEVLAKKMMAAHVTMQNTFINDLETFHDEVDNIKLDNLPNFEKTIKNCYQDKDSVDEVLSKTNHEPVTINKLESNQESNPLTSLKKIKKAICFSKVSAPIASFIDSLKLNEEIESVVHLILSKDTLEFMMLYNVVAFSKLSKDLNEELAHVEESFGLCETGKIIAVKASDGEWYRALVLSCEDKKPNVLLIDTGFCEPALTFFPLHPKHHFLASQLGVIKPLKSVDSKMFDLLEKHILQNQPQPFIGKVTSIKSDSIIITGNIGDMQPLEYEVKPYTWIQKRYTKNEIETKLCSKDENSTNLIDDASVVEFKGSLSCLDDSYTFCEDLPEPVDYMGSIPRQKLKEKTHKSVPLYQDPEDNSVFYILGNSKSFI